MLYKIMMVQIFESMDEMMFKVWPFKWKVLSIAFNCKDAADYYTVHDRSNFRVCGSNHKV